MRDEAQQLCTNRPIHTVYFVDWKSPRVVRDRQLHAIKCTFRSGVTGQGIIAHYFFENGNPTIVTGERYRTMLQFF